MKSDTSANTYDAATGSDLWYTLHNNIPHSVHPQASVSLIPQPHHYSSSCNIKDNPDLRCVSSSDYLHWQSFPTIKESLQPTVLTPPVFCDTVAAHLFTIQNRLTNKQTNKTSSAFFIYLLHFKASPKSLLYSVTHSKQEKQESGTRFVSPIVFSFGACVFSWGCWGLWGHLIL